MATSDFENQLAALEEEKDAALGKVDEKYDGLISQSDKFYQDRIDATRNYADEQKKLQQEQTDFTIQQIQQEKEQLGKDYTKEQSAAYVDFKKQTDAHGVNAEKIAAGGMWGSGYSESAQTAMYTEYQRRVATAKASFDQAVVEYNNAMKQAELQNSSVLAEIAFNALQQKLSLEMQMFTDRNSLLDAQANARAQVEGNYLKVLEQLEENRYNTKPGMNDAFSKWVTYLQNEYKDGYISDETLWQELATTYGETALKQAGFYNSYTSAGSDGKTMVNTQYYQGEINSDAATYGTFSNGYQPKGISGHGKLKKSGETLSFDTKVQYGAEAGQVKTVTQNIWVAEDGSKWYWEGRQNRYIQYNAQSTGTSIEKQLSELGMAGISPQELMRRIESGEIVMIEHEDGTYTLKKGTKKNTNAESALKTDGVDLSNVSKPSKPAAFTPTVAPGSDPAQAAGQVFGQWLGHILGI